MMTRVLPVEEWPRLRGTDAETVWPSLDPARSVIIVVEDQGLIVAHHILLFVLHAEALWVHPAYRKGMAGGRLWQAVKRAIAGVRAKGVVTAAVDDQVRALIAKVGGTRLETAAGAPIALFVIPTEGR